MNLILSIISLISLAILGANILFFHSLLLGVIIAPIYLFIVSLFCGNVFFPQESQRFRIFYGFVVFFCLLVVLGTIAYLIRDLSNFPILAILILLTVFLICLNWKRRPLPSLAGIKLKEKINKLNLGVLDFLFLALMGLSFYFLFAARTGESIPPPWSLLPGQFFICLILAIAVLLVKIWHGKSPSGLLLFYVILVILIPASGLLILMHQPYLTMKGAIGLENDRMVTEFGKFVSDPTLPEAAKSIMGKNILQMGQFIGDVFLIKLLQVPPVKFALFLVPILFTLMVVSAAFDLMRSLAPGQKGLALICSLSFLATQHNIFLFTPPGKNETFALGLLMVSMMLWLKFLQEQRFRWASFITPVILLGAILLIHQFVGLFALFLALLTFSLFLLKPFPGGLPRLLPWLGLSIGFIFIWVYGYPYLLSLASYLSGIPVGGDVGFHQLSMPKFTQTIAPSLWSGEGLGILQGIFYTFINNSVYVTYALILLGAVAAFRYRLNKNWLAISLSSTVLIFVYFGVVGNFSVPSESYRYFYYLNFVSLPLMGVGIYWFFSYIAGTRFWIYTRSEEKEKFVSLMPLQLVICGLLLASLFTSSIYAGYPRPDSMGYNHPQWQIRYPSDYDVAALDFIEAREGNEPYGDFFIVGDTPTCAAGVVTMGHQVISTAEGYVPIFSFFSGPWGTDEFFNLAASEPIKYLVEGAHYTNGLADRTYLIFTYRLGMDRLKSLVNIYFDYLGEPVYAIENKVYMFSYNREQIATLLGKGAEGELILFDDEPVDKFWELQLIGTGNLTFSISDNNEVKKRGSSSLQVTISPGESERATLRHVWDKPLDLSEAKYLLLFVYGTGSGQPFHVVFRSTEPATDNFFYYDKSVDNFEGWKLLVVPLKSFKTGGSPDWKVIKEMLIQFRGKWSSGEIYFDRISGAEEIGLQLLYEESVINLP